MRTLSRARNFDAIVVGAGVAGAAAAILLRRSGFSVLMLDKRRSLDDYKPLCTHFIQPFANSVFHDLGVEHLLEPAYSVCTRAAFHVPGGMIDVQGGYGEDPVSAYAHNLERRVMDPALRQQCIAVGVDIRMGADIVGIEELADGHAVTFEPASGDPDTRITVAGSLVIAADGRRSQLASLLDAPETFMPNERMAYFCQCSGVETPQGNRSLFVLNNREMSFLYPLIGGRTLLSVYITAERGAAWGAARNAWPQLLQQFETHLPDISFANARQETEILSYRRYDNQIRPAVHAGVPFIGDASVSLDPMSGVGCSFALKSARLLVDAVLASPDDRTRALSLYDEAHRSFFTAHIQGIAADSRVAKSDAAVAATYAVILEDETLQRAYLDLTARLITPSQFQRAYLVSAARRMTRQTAGEAI